MTDTCVDELQSKSGKSQHGFGYLKADVHVEPLVGHWAAWPQLLSPIQFAMNTAFRHVPAMQSFIRTPKMHASASKKPEMFSGPFMQLNEQDVPKVEALLENTIKTHANAIEFAKEYKRYAQSVQSTATGHSLEKLYESLPCALQGKVELVYDASGRGNVRVIEELIDVTQNHQIALCSKADSERQFFSNTPRFEDENTLIISSPFSSKAIDKLSRSRWHGADLAELEDEFEIEQSKRSFFRSFFVPEPPEVKTNSKPQDDLRIRYFGHACVLLETSAGSVLVDPTGTWKDNAGSLTLADLPNSIDLVLITHGHPDHFMPEILLQIRHRVKKILVAPENSGSVVDTSLKAILKQLGFDNVQYFAPFEVERLGDLEIIALPFHGEHADLDIRSKQSFLVRSPDKALMFMADSNVADVHLYRQLVTRFGCVDTLFIGMECFGAPLTWLYAPLLTQVPNRRDDESRRLSGCDFKRAWSVVQELNCKEVFVYAMGQEHWLKHIMGLNYEDDSPQITESNKLIEKCKVAGLRAERLFGSQEICLSKDAV